MIEKGNERKILYYLCFPKSSPMLFKWGLDELQHGRAHRTSARTHFTNRRDFLEKSFTFQMYKNKSLLCRLTTLTVSWLKSSVTHNREFIKGILYVPILVLFFKS